MLKRFSTLAVCSYIALLSALAPALFLPKVARTQEATQESREYEPCDPEPTDMTVNYGDGFSCEIEGAGDADVYRVQATAGDRVVFSVAATGEYPRTLNYRRQAEVVDPNGNTLDKGADRGVIFNLTLEQTGTYTFIVSSYKKDTDFDVDWGTGSYVVEFSCLAGSCGSAQN